MQPERSAMSVPHVMIHLEADCDAPETSFSDFFKCNSGMRSVSSNGDTFLQKTFIFILKKERGHTTTPRKEF
jgi:hypothetical protein